MQFQTDFLYVQLPFSHVLYCILVNELLCFQMMVKD